MEEDLFKKMMDRWGVKPSGKDKSYTPPPAAASQPKQASKPVEPEPLEPEQPLDPDEAMFLRAMGHLGLREGGTTYDAPELIEGSPLPDDDQALFLNAIDNMEGPAIKGESEEDRRAALRRIKMRKQAELKVGAVLDLHGKTVDEALKALAQFVAANFAKGVDTAMVITGKGRHSHGGASRLKPAVERWILQKGKRFIVRYGEAPRAYGGRGAFVLYMRKE